MTTKYLAIENRSLGNYCLPPLWWGHFCHTSALSVFTSLGEVGEWWSTKCLYWHNIHIWAVIWSFVFSWIRSGWIWISHSALKWNLEMTNKYRFHSKTIWITISVQVDWTLLKNPWSHSLWFNSPPLKFGGRSWATWLPGRLRPAAWKLRQKNSPGHQMRACSRNLWY